MADSNQDSALNNQSKDETASNHQCKINDAFSNYDINMNNSQKLTKK